MGIGVAQKNNDCLYVNCKPIFLIEDQHIYNPIFDSNNVLNSYVHQELAKIPSSYESNSMCNNPWNRDLI